MEAAIPACAQQQQYNAESDFKAVPVDGGKGAMITEYVGDRFEVRIPPRIQNLPVTHIGDGAFYMKGITSVTMPNSITSIGMQAFRNCTSLISITIPNSVTSIGEWAFYVCDSLATITVTAQNTAYTSQNGILYNKAKTALIAYPAKKTDASFAIPEGVTSISAGAFSSCTSLTSVTIPNSVTSISAGAFIDCTSLASVTMPGSVTEIGYGAFTDCSSLAAINVDAANTAYSSVDGVLYNKDKTHLLRYPPGKTASSFAIPNGVTRIGVYAFSGCASLASLITNGYTWIENYAFSGCTSLASLVTNGDTYIENYAFSGCTSLASLTILNNILIQRDSFEFSSLASVTLGNGVTSITTDFGSLYFSDNLAAINVDAGNTEFCSVDGVLYNKDKTCLLRYPPGKTVSSFAIPNSVTSIGGVAFSGCSSLASVTIPSSVTYIGGDAFYYCSSLASVTFEGTILSSSFNVIRPFDGDLRAKFYATDATNGTPGTYTRPNTSSEVWTKQ